MRLLGKKAVRHDVRTLWLKALMPDLPAPPPARDWSSKLPENIGMYQNDVLGDCTCASAAHLVQTWTSASGSVVNPAVTDVVDMYKRFGYDPSNPDSDHGAVMLDVLNSWRNVGLGGHKIGAYAKLDHHDVDHVKAAIDYFGGVYIGAQLPKSAQSQDPWMGSGSPLIGDDQPGGWGGHCMAAVKYDRTHVTFLTWGERKQADWQWWLDYVDEAYAIISPDWLDPHTNQAPVGLPIATISEYLLAIGT